jgi:hypothetical protein
VPVAFRLANWDTPFWVNPNRRASRYMDASAGIIQYWSLHPLAPWAEQLRALNMREPVEALELRLRPWAASLSLPEGVLRISFDNAAAHGIDPAALVDDDWTACQRWAAGIDAPGLIVPSAALPGTENVVMFGPRVRSRWGIRPVDPSVDVPADPVADRGIGFTELLAHVRWRGTPHAGYEAWRQGLSAPAPPRVEVPRSA